MRFDEFVLRVPDDEFHIRFHDQLTVLAGIGTLERHALAESLVGAMTGDSDGTILTCSDHTGRPMELITHDGRVQARFLDDGAPAPAPIGWFAPDATALRELLLVGAEDIGLAVDQARADETPELAEARATLRALGQELHEALVARRRIERARADLAGIEHRLRSAEGGAARRAYAKVLAELERVRAEAAVLQSGDTGFEADRRLLESAEEARALSVRWAKLSASLRDAEAAYGDDDRLDDSLLAVAGDLPDDAPDGLAELVAAADAAAERVATLEARLHELATASLEEPTDPRVPVLATANQERLWAAHADLLASSETVEREQVALGGIGVDAERAAAILELEDSHSRAGAAEATMDRYRVPVIASSALSATAAIILAAAAPMLALALLILAAGFATAGVGRPFISLRAARRAEEAALAVVGVPTYLSFHMRRVDATLDPGSRERLELAVRTLAMAARAWSEVAGDVPMADATSLEFEVREFADSLRRQSGAVEQLTEMRRELDVSAVPELEGRKEELTEVVATLGFDASDLLGLNGTLWEVVANRLALGERARRQRVLEGAEADEHKEAAQLDDLLTALGFEEGSLEARVGALDWAIERAREREQARRTARPKETIEADVARLQAEARALRRPEFSAVDSAEADEPDVHELEADRERLAAGLAADEPLVIGFDRLADRHAAMERRVATIESQLGDRGGEGVSADLADVHQYLFAHLTRATHAGPRGEPLPVLLDEPFLRVPAERKWELMDMLRRLAEKTQLLYLTDDPFVGAWARRRASTGTITLLEPVEEANV